MRVLPECGRGVGGRLAILLCALILMGGGERSLAQMRAVQSASPPVSRPSLAVTPLPPPVLQRFTLRDGTTVLLARDARTPLVYLDILLGVGSWSPWMRQHNGAQAFRAQVRDQQGTLERDAERLQIWLGTSVGRFGSSVSLRFAKADTAAALSLLLRTLANRDFDAGALRRQKWARRPTWTSQLKEPAFLLGQAAARLFFADNDLRRLDFEEPPPYTSDVWALAGVRDQLLRAPSRLVTLVGDLDSAEALRLATGLLPPPQLPPDIDQVSFAPQFLAEVPRGRDTALTLPRLTQVFFQYARLSPACTDADYASLLLADTVLYGGSLQSRLSQALREEGGDTYVPSTNLPMERVPGIYSIRASTRVANALQMEQKLRQTLAAFHREGITASDLERARGQLLKSRERSSTAAFARIYEASWEWQRGLPAGSRGALYDRLGQVSLAEVNDLIRRFYDPVHFALLRVGPP